MALLALRGWMPADNRWGLDPRWLYALTLPVVGGLLLLWWREYGELQAANRPSWGEGLASVAIGAGVFAAWIHLDAPWMQVGEAAARFVPLGAQGELIWPLVAVRWLGAALVVPVMEELFWRSFLMRWVDNPDFEQVSPQTASIKAIALSTFAFTLAHTLWLGAIVAGLAYAWLYKRTGSLWAPVVAHAVTNGVLGIWVVVWGQWAFW